MAFPLPLSPICSSKRNFNLCLFINFLHFCESPNPTHLSTFRPPTQHKVPVPNSLRPSHSHVVGRVSDLHRPPHTKSRDQNPFVNPRRHGARVFPGHGRDLPPASVRVVVLFQLFHESVHVSHLRQSFPEVVPPGISAMSG